MREKVITKQRTITINRLIKIVIEFKLVYLKLKKVRIMAMITSEKQRRKKPAIPQYKLRNFLKKLLKIYFPYAGEELVFFQV